MAKSSSLVGIASQRERRRSFHATAASKMADAAKGIEHYRKNKDNLFAGAGQDGG